MPRRARLGCLAVRILVLIGIKGLSFRQGKDGKDGKGKDKGKDGKDGKDGKGRLLKLFSEQGGMSSYCMRLILLGDYQL